MRKQLGKAYALLRGRRGETLLEGIVSILVFTVLVVSITMMLMLSMRITGIANTNANAQQEEIYGVFTGHLGTPGLPDYVELIVTHGEIKMGLDDFYLNPDEDATPPDIIESVSISKYAAPDGVFTAFSP